MRLIPSNLQAIIAGCTQLPRGIAEQLAELWEVSGSADRPFTEFLVASDLTHCDAQDLEFVSDAQRCRPAEFECRVDGFGPVATRLRNEWFEGGAGSGALHIWETPIPTFAFAATLVRADAVAAARRANRKQRLATTGRQPEARQSESAIATRIVAAQELVRVAPVRPPAAGDTLGRCILERELGRGASGIVFLATHTKLGIKVAVKVLHPTEPGSQDDPLEVVRGEARLLAQISHPNVVRVFDVEDEGPWPYMVMEYVEGKSLAEALEPGPLPVAEAVRVITQAAEGLAAANRLGVIHRDVKPDNIALTADGQVKVIDFGLGVHAHAVPTDTGGRLVGTAHYLSPEQADSAPHLDHRSDMYSLGATLYHALTGRPPFEGPALPALLLQHATKEPVPPRAVRTEIPVRLDAVVLKLLSKAPDQRYATYDALLADLGTALQPISKPPKGVKKGLIASWLRTRTQNAPRE